MKHPIFLKLAAVAMLAVIVTTGCRTKNPKNVTPIYGSATRVGTDQKSNALTNTTTGTDPLLDPGAGLRGTPSQKTINADSIPTRPVEPPFNPDAGLPTMEMIGDRLADRVAFAVNTVHFDYDKAIVKASELGKLKPVAAALKAAPQNKLQVEGHCDERGTEEYNRALGERRALAVRAQLIKLGVAPDRITTASFGEDRPAALGHDEAAWAKNRRGELVLLKPKN